MKGLSALEAEILAMANGAKTGPTGDLGPTITNAIDVLIKRRLLVLGSQPLPESTEYAEHFVIQITPAGCFMLTLYRQGIR